ncbi:hypothetical protein [Streptomyces sp. cmx-10-25]|uniref:hypothetical protein n=1 Tax=Streptomyces sp. cmx-10-25 TaxID=2790919 RepID=UPI00397ED3A4
MPKSSTPGTAVVAAALALLVVSCGASDTNGAGAPAGTSASVATTAPAGQEAGEVPTTADAGGSAAPTDAEDATPRPDTTPVERVRDAFAGLRATLDDSCADPGNCAYVLGRVYDELQRMDRAMKGDEKGPGHFPEPIALIEKLNGELDGDRSFENLKKHQSLLIGTRDRINTWMQGHPDDYR